MFKAIDKVLAGDPLILRLVTPSDFEEAKNEMLGMKTLLKLLMSQAQKAKLDSPMMERVRLESIRLATEMQARSVWYPDLTLATTEYTKSAKVFLEALFLTNPSDLDPLMAMQGLSFLHELDVACRCRASSVAMYRGVMANASFDFTARQAGAHSEPKDVQ